MESDRTAVINVQDQPFLVSVIKQWLLSSAFPNNPVYALSPAQYTTQMGETLLPRPPSSIFLPGSAIPHVRDVDPASGTIHPYGAMWGFMASAARAEGMILPVSPLES